MKNKSLLALLAIPVVGFKSCRDLRVAAGNKDFAKVMEIANQLVKK